MPNPTPSDLHVNVPLTNVSIAYLQKPNRFIADKVFPRVPVAHQGNLYYKFNKEDWRRTDVQRRAPGTETVGVGWNQSMDQYFAHVYGVHKDIDDQLRANADSVFKLDSTATNFVTNQLLMRRDLDWAAAYFRPGVWGEDIHFGATGTDATRIRWDLATSDPIQLLGDLQTEFIQRTGEKANGLVLGANVRNRLKNHPEIIDRIKYTQKGIVTEDLISTLFDVDKIYTSYATVSTGPSIPDSDAQAAASDNPKFVCDPNSALLFYSNGSPSIESATAGYTFTWNGYLAGNAQGIRIKRFRMEHIAADRIEGEMTYDMKVVCADMGLYMHDVVGTDATTATAGTPGSFGDGATPHRLADLSGVTASPTTAWTAGQYVRLGDGTQANWNGTAWEAGVA